jgi:phenylacetic acid degradation operon negative regulatory protein
VPTQPARLDSRQGAPTAAGGRQLQQLVITVCALYGRGERSSIAASELVRLLAPLDVDEAAARSALSRLKKRGVLLSARKDGSAAYRLDPALEDVFSEGDERIFAPRRAKPGDRWLLAAFSVPEAQRNLRHQIRRVLMSRGFGTVAAGLWIAPEFVYEHLRRELEREGLGEFVEFFAADVLGAEVGHRVGEWWDLAALADLYAGFLAQFEPVEAHWRRRRDEDRVRAFADHVLLLTAWRRLPYLDPGLPVEYLPQGWPGVAARGLFDALHTRLADPARRYAESVITG